MEPIDKICYSMICGGLLLLAITLGLKADAREKAIWKQAIEYGYAEQVIESDQIVFKWKIPASATAELK